jgi:NADP-dependent 3-hydroxy acid dehydrogenase YdfG
LAGHSFTNRRATSSHNHQASDFAQCEVAPPGAVVTELPDAITEPEVAANMRKFYDEFAIPVDSFARAVVFAMSQPDEVDVNEILFRPTRQEL